MFYWIIATRYNAPTILFYSFGPFFTFKIALSHQRAFSAASLNAYVVPSPFHTADLFIRNFKERYTYINDAIHYIMGTGEYQDE